MPDARDDAAAPTPGHDAEVGDDDLLHLLVETVRDYAIFVLDRHGNIRTWNPGAERLKGWRAEEIIGRHFSNFYPDEDVARGKPAYELRVASQYGRFHDEGWRVRRDGSRFWADVVITALRDANGKVVGFGKVTRDLTERRLGEEALRLSEERFRLLVESAADYAMFVLDTDGRIQSWNLGAQRITGYRASEIVGRHFSVFYPKRDLEARKPERELEIATRVGKYEEEGWRLRKDGTRFWANVVVTALREPHDGRLIGFSKVTRDLTRRREAEEDLRAAYKDMEAFGFTVSHDLRAPLRAIEMLAEYTLRDDGPNLSPHAKENVTVMLASAKRASQLVEGLLAFARASAGELTVEPVDVLVLAKEVEATLRQAYTHPVELVLPDSALLVNGDPRLVRVVVSNLLSNAWKFTQKQPKPRVEIVVEDEDETGVTWAVKDNGVGFDPARISELFEPFRRLHAEKEFAGTGIGLSTVRRVVERHGGRMWAEGVPGKGAAFHVMWPSTAGRILDGREAA